MDNHSYGSGGNKRASLQNLAAEIGANNKQFFTEDICKVQGEDDRCVSMELETPEITLEMNYDMVWDETEDSSDESEVDTDVCNGRSQLAVLEYVEDLYANYRRLENCSLVSPDYISQQHDIDENMRAELIDWLVEVHDRFKLQPETLLLTVNLVDRFLSKQSATSENLKLVGLVAMFLCSKYEESKRLCIEDLTLYSKSEIFELEKLMLTTLEFNMSCPTAYVFLNRFLSEAQSEPKLDQLSFFLIELCLVEYEMVKFPPSLLAAASVYTAQCCLYGLKQWSNTCEWHTKYSEDQILECSRMIVGYHQRAAEGKFTNVYKKYNTSKFGCVARCEPATILVEQTNNSYNQNDNIT